MATTTIYLKIRGARETPQNIDTQDYYSIAQYLKDVVEEVSRREGRPIYVRRVNIAGFTDKGLKTIYEYTSDGTHVHNLEAVFIAVLTNALTNWRFWVGIITAFASIVLILKMLNASLTVHVGNTTVNLDPGDGDDSGIGTDPGDGDYDDEEENESVGIGKVLLGLFVLIVGLSKLAGAW